MPPKTKKKSPPRKPPKKTSVSTLPPRNPAYLWLRTQLLNSRIDPTVAGREIEKLMRQYGGNLKAEHVLDAARDPKNPLHPCFEWDDSVAAEKFRLEQAGYLVRHLRVEIPQGAGQEIHVRPFLSTPNVDGRSRYVTRRAAFRNPSVMAEVVDAASELLDGAAERLREVRGLEAEATAAALLASKVRKKKP